MSDEQQAQWEAEADAQARAESEQAESESELAQAPGSAAQPEEVKLLCFIEGADSAEGTITLRSPASISGIRIGDLAIAILKRYPVTPNTELSDRRDNPEA